jgi:hypothetical protein
MLLPVLRGALCTTQLPLEGRLCPASTCRRKRADVHVLPGLYDVGFPSLGVRLSTWSTTDNGCLRWTKNLEIKCH